MTKVAVLGETRVLLVGVPAGGGWDCTGSAVSSRRGASFPPAWPLRRELEPRQTNHS